MSTQPAGPGVALVTGGSRGIGAGIALALGAAGWDVAVNYRSDAEAAQGVVKALVERGRRALAVAADVTDPDAVAAMVERVEGELGPLGALVNNVGEFFFKPVAAMSYDEWRHVIDSNLTSAFVTSSAVLPRMRARRYGRVVNIGLGPVHHVRAAPNIAAYAVAKTGIVVLTLSMAAEEAPYGVTVNCVSPGLIDNGFLPPDQDGWMRKRVPMGRLGEPAEVGDAVAFLVSEKASYVSGANLTVSGGWDWFNRPVDHDGDVTALFLEGESV